MYRNHIKPPLMLWIRYECGNIKCPICSWLLETCNTWNIVPTSWTLVNAKIGRIVSFSIYHENTDMWVSILCRLRYEIWISYTKLDIPFMKETFLPVRIQSVCVLSLYFCVGSCTSTTISVGSVRVNIVSFLQSSQSASCFTIIIISHFVSVFHSCISSTNPTRVS